MRAYPSKWAMRPEKVDCLVCKGDISDENLDENRHKLIRPGECCAGTGLDELPWTELFKKGRRQWNGVGLGLQIGDGL